MGNISKVGPLGSPFGLGPGGRLDDIYFAPSAPEFVHAGLLYDAPVTWVMKNSLFVIAPYKYSGMWVFDDPSVGLVKEPFVAGIDTMIDRIVTDFPNPERGFRLLFSTAEFRGYTFKLEWRREESGGNWYYSPDFSMEGWLCPALYCYFDTAPRELFIEAQPKPE